MDMRKFILPFLFLALSLPEPSYAKNDLWPFGKKKETEKVVVKKLQKTQYQKFTEKNGLKSSASFAKIYRDESKIILELPDSVIGRSIMMTSHVVTSSDEGGAAGLDASSSENVFDVGIHDSTIVLTASKGRLVVRDSSMRAAVADADIPAIAYSFPARFRNADSTAWVIDVSRLFSPSCKNMVSFKGKSMDGGTIYDSKVHSGSNPIWSELVSRPKVVGVRYTVTMDLQKPILIFLATTPVTMELESDIILLDDKAMPMRKEDSRVGVRKVPYRIYDSRSNVKSENAAQRWDLRGGKKIRIFVDTLFVPNMARAVGDGIKAWNEAFKRIGLGEPIEVLPYSVSRDFHADDPFVSTVSLVPGSGGSLSFQVNADKLTGEIFGVHINVPVGIRTGIHREASALIADVDPRYRNFNVRSDAVYETLRAKVMSIFGQCLGLAPNYAGSYAYSPAQLRDPEFTKTHGISSSVTDNVLYNILARPGDKQRGVSTIVDKLGTYDKFAIEWLYKEFPQGTDEESELRKMVDSHVGDPEYLYLPLASGDPDPRALDNDLGNDPLEAYKSSVSHLKYAFRNADKWIEADDVDETGYRQLYLEWLWLDFMKLPRAASPWVGGIFIDNVTPGTDAKKYTAVPEAIQRACLKTIMDQLSDVSWMNVNRRLIEMSGIAAGLDSYTQENIFSQSRLMKRLPNVMMAAREAGSTYTTDDFMTDLQDAMLAVASDGHFSGQEESQVESYLKALTSLSPVAQINFKEVKKKAVSLAEEKDGAEEESYRQAFRSVPGQYTVGTQALAMKYLERAGKKLRAFRAGASDDLDRASFDYLISMVDAALKGDK